MAPSEWLTRYVQLSTIGNSRRQARRGSRSIADTLSEDVRPVVIEDAPLRGVRQVEREELLDVLAHRFHAGTWPVGAPDSLGGDLRQAREVLEQLRRRNPRHLEVD